MFAYIFLLIASYFLGCLNTAYYLVKFLEGKDIRSTGSANAGATNVGRLLGKKGFIITFVGDSAKGIIALFVARWLNFNEIQQVFVIIAVVIGHIYPFQLGFKGGKGAATMGNTLIAFDFWLILYILPILFILLAITKKFTISGLTAALFIPVVAIFLKYSIPLILSLTLLTAIVIFAHRKNIQEFYQLTFSKTDKKP